MARLDSGDLGRRRVYRAEDGLGRRVGPVCFKGGTNHRGTEITEEDNTERRMKNEEQGTGKEGCLSAIPCLLWFPRSALIISRNFV